jgi:hypothetical protein
MADTPRSPIHFGPISNGEYEPIAPPHGAAAERMVQELATLHAPRHGMDRRTFLRGPLGTAAALLAISRLTGCRDGEDGDPYSGIDEDLLCDADAARELLSGDEFILDAQTHHVDADDLSWQGPGWLGFLQYLASEAGCTDGSVDCFSYEAYVHELFVRSDTTVALISAVPAVPESSPLNNERMGDTLRMVNRLADSQRVIAHAGVFPNLGADHLDSMATWRGRLDIVAWKTYTGFDSGTSLGWYLDDDIGAAFLARVRDVGPRIVCIHKGLNLGPTGGVDYYSPRDMGPAASANPDIDLVAYHSGYVNEHVEGAYDDEEPEPQGVDRLVRTVREAGLAVNEGNVWAELGSTWQIVMQRPVEAAHVLGKLLLHLGERRILWGTDSIWYGSPQSQIEAFRAFQIPEELREKHGFPELTDAIKARILGLNAAGLFGVDPESARCSLAEDQGIALRRHRAREFAPDGPGVYGPRTRRQWWRLLGKEV